MEQKATYETGALQMYGSHEEIRELADRAKRFLPNGSNLKDHEALALAQISVAYSLNPFNGEVWYIPAKGPMVGIKGLRKAARKQSGYVMRQHDMTIFEREQRLLQDGDQGRFCELYRCDLGLQMQQANVPFIGEGIARQNERAPATKSLIWLADKRAEADALKKAFDLPFGFDEQRNGSAPGDLPQVKVIGAPTESKHERTAAEASAELFGDWGEEVFAAGEDDPPARPEPSPEPDAEPPADDKAKAAPAPKSAKPAVVKTARWEGAIEEICAQTDHYSKDGKPCGGHLARAAAKEGFAEITSENIEAVVKRLVDRVAEGMKMT